MTVYKLHVIMFEWRAFFLSGHKKQTRLYNTGLFCLCLLSHAS